MLRRINQNLPEFIVLPDPNGLPYNNHGNFVGFLPAQHQGTVIDASDTQPVRYLFPPKTAKHINTASEAASRAVLAKLNARHMARTPGDSRHASKALRWPRGCSERTRLFDLKGESPAVRSLYGADEKPTADFAKRCILGRRMLDEA